MASAPSPSPPDPRELERLRRRADERRRRRERWTPWLTLALALVVHVLGALFGVWWALRRPEPPARPERQARLRFVPPQPQAEEAPEPVDSERISDRDVEARAPEPEPEPPPILQPPEPPPSPRVEPRPPRPETPPEPEPQPEPEPEPPPEDPTQLTYDEKRERVKDLLRDWSSPSRPPSDPYESFPTIPPDALRGGPDVQFESSADVDWGPYAARIKRIVRTNWRIPTLAQVGGRGGTQLHFYIACDGSIEELEQVVPSGKLPLDVAAENALQLSNKLPPPPLPPEYCEERVGVTWSFFYNMSERELRLWYRERAVEQRRRMNGTAE